MASLSMLLRVLGTCAYLVQGNGALTGNVTQMTVHALTSGTSTGTTELPTSEATVSVTFPVPSTPSVSSASFDYLSTMIAATSDQTTKPPSSAAPAETGSVTVTVEPTTDASDDTTESGAENTTLQTTPSPNTVTGSFTASDMSTYTENEGSGSEQPGTVNTTPSAMFVSEASPSKSAVTSPRSASVTASEVKNASLLASTVSTLAPSPVSTMTSIALPVTASAPPIATPSSTTSSAKATSTTRITRKTTRAPYASTSDEMVYLAIPATLTAAHILTLLSPAIVAAIILITACMIYARHYRPIMTAEDDEDYVTNL